ncbi:winged helix-turn-helix domain-containing protein [Thalassospira sp. TSL5-1]|uniref:winged helix-turn-helix domain-containing protein n=1 Tax=Thalassospira sp. TSL5-1 TaxID=1544451 RepID=UPI00093A5CD7|nr:winged helix-turn-helix domain-containing protein [Thalassospira sp. TSL5-1]OKH86446.1 hypothetical protein LF95_22465 [Thalassospira sp. TSL5-1]
MTQGSFEENLAKLRKDLAEDREKISSETSEIYREIATFAPSQTTSSSSTHPSAYLGLALATERKLGRLAERLGNIATLEKCRLAAALLEACEAVTAEGRGATPRRLMQFMAYEGDSSSHYENLIGAMDVFAASRKPTSTSEGRITPDLVKTIATRTSLRSRNWLSDQEAMDWNKVLQEKEVPCPIDIKTITQFSDQINTLDQGNGIIAVADAIYIVSKWLYELDLEYSNLAPDTRHQNISFETENPQTIYWNRTSRLLIPYIVAHFCDGIFLPLMCGLALSECQVKLRPLFTQNAPVKSARPHTLKVIASGLDKLDQTEKLVSQHWGKAEKLATDGRGTNLSKITTHLFDNGTICVADIVQLCDLTPQAAHYQLKRLLEAGLISRGPRGKVGGHYFLDLLLRL